MEKIVLEEVVLEDKRENSDDSNHIETKRVRDNHDKNVRVVLLVHLLVVCFV